MFMGVSLSKSGSVEISSIWIFPRTWGWWHRLDIFDRLPSLKLLYPVWKDLSFSKEEDCFFAFVPGSLRCFRDDNIHVTCGDIFVESPLLELFFPFSHTILRLQCHNIEDSGGDLPGFEAILPKNRTYCNLKCIVLGDVDTVDLLLKGVPFLVISNAAGALWRLLSFGRGRRSLIKQSLVHSVFWHGIWVAVEAESMFRVGRHVSRQRMTLEIEREVKKFQGLRGCGCTLTGLEAHWKLTTNNLWQKCSLTGPCKKERHFLQATAE